MGERKPKWAWSSVDDPSPRYPICDHCDAFARWAVGEVGDECTFADVTIRYFACGSHINRALTGADWLLDTLCVFDLTQPEERP